MMWFITQVRRQSMRGMLRMVLPLFNSDQNLKSCSSLAPAKAARPSTTNLSNDSSNSLVVAGIGGGSEGLPPGARSRESCLMVMVVQEGMLARCPANQPMVPDFSWGFHENLLSGTRSRVLRVLAISRSNSGRSAALRDISSSCNYSPFLQDANKRRGGKCIRMKSESQISNHRGSQRSQCSHIQNFLVPFSNSLLFACIRGLMVSGSALSSVTISGKKVLVVACYLL